MDTIEKADLTDRAIAGGWTLPDGWTVLADLSPDYDHGDPGEEYDCYGAAQVAAWRADEWAFGVVSVWVEDADGREWGRDVLGAVEYGCLPNEDEDGEVTGSAFIEPLEDRPAEYSVIREYDMIGNALRDAAEQLAAFGTPMIVEPDGPAIAGL